MFDKGLLEFYTGDDESGKDQDFNLEGDHDENGHDITFQYDNTKIQDFADCIRV